VGGKEMNPLIPGIDAKGGLRGSPPQIIGFDRGADCP